MSRRDNWSGRQLRRLFTAPAVILVTVLIGFTFPLWLVAAAALSPLLPGRWRPLRVLWVTILYLVCESVLLVILFGLWVSSGLGRRIRTPYYEGIHYDLVQGLLWIFFREARRVLNLTIETAGPSPDAHPGRPLLVCCRHGGPGDSFMLIYALMHWYDREPRVVLKDTLAWDPAIDVLLHRIPARFITPNPGAGERIEDQIAELASGLDENDAFVIFPEGGNFTPRRRERAIERLHKLGMHRMADRAEAMTNVLAPRPGGFLAALDAAPEADVVMVAHTGTDHMLTVGDVWRELPMDKRLLMQWWQVPRAEIPADREAQIEWLFGWWERIDLWIDEHRAEDLPARRAVRALPLTERTGAGAGEQLHGQRVGQPGDVLLLAPAVALEGEVRRRRGVHEEQVGGVAGFEARPKPEPVGNDPDDLPQSLAPQLLAVGDHRHGVGLVGRGVGHFLDGSRTAEDLRVAPDERRQGLAPRPGRDDVGEERLLRGW